jgi:hypothetical protein
MQSAAFSLSIIEMLIVSPYYLPLGRILTPEQVWVQAKAERKDTDVRENLGYKRLMAPTLP